MKLNHKRAYLQLKEKRKATVEKQTQLIRVEAKLVVVKK